MDRPAIVGTPERARDSWRHSGADRVVLSPAYPELGAALDSLAQMLGQ